MVECAHDVLPVLDPIHGVKEGRKEGSNVQGGARARQKTQKNRKWTDTSTTRCLLFVPAQPSGQLKGGLKKGVTPFGGAGMTQMTQEGREVHDLRQMAEFLFGSDSAVHAYAALAMLTEDRLLFKQTERHPPTFQPRPPSEVQQLKAALAKQEQVRGSIPP